MTGLAARIPMAKPKKPVPASSPQKDFVSKIRPFARAVAAKTGISEHMLIGQAALETGWGKKVSTDAKTGRNSHNLFNIKGKGPAGSVTVSTTEVIRGKTVRMNADFRAYNNVGESFSDFANLMKKPRYRKAMKHAGNPGRFADELQKAGYATDPKYASKLKSIMGRVVKLGSPGSIRRSGPPSKTPKRGDGAKRGLAKPTTGTQEVTPKNLTRRGSVPSSTHKSAISSGGRQTAQKSEGKPKAGNQGVRRVRSLNLQRTQKAPSRRTHR